ncbi:MAG: hypothetical protein ACO3AG_08400 [Fluviibacter sp.]|jgi:hypothetical protein
MIIRPYIPKRKPKKPNAKQRELARSWEAILKKYGPVKKIASAPVAKAKPFVRETPKIPSLPFTGDACVRPADKVYTGDAMIGIGTLHKSNAVPVFSSDEAKEMARMRRG